MTDYREIIRLKSLEFSNVAIANSLGCSRNTVSEVLKLAETHSLGWAIPDALSNTDIEHLFYPDRGNNEGRRLPDFEYIYNELAKPGVRFHSYGQNTVPSVSKSIRFRTSTHSLMTSIMLMPQQRKQRSESNVNPVKLWKLTGLAIPFMFMTLPVAATYLHIYLLQYFHAACIPMQKPFLT